MLLSTPVDVSVGGLGLFEVGGTFFFPCILPLEKNTLPSIEKNPEKKKFQPHAKRVTTKQVHRLGCPGALPFITKAQNRLRNLVFCAKSMILEAPAPVYGTGVP